MFHVNGKFQVVAVRNKISTFDGHVGFFREVFKSYAFFRYDSQDPFGLMDRINSDLTRLECVMKDIQSSGSLFEVNVPEFKLLKQCRKELRMLKVINFRYIKRFGRHRHSNKLISSNSGTMSF